MMRTLIAGVLLAATIISATPADARLEYPQPYRGELTDAFTRPAIHSRLSRFIIHKRGTPERVAADFAEALSQTRWPATLAAIGAAEGTFNPNEPRGSAGEMGAFRIIPKHWGKVPKDIAGQVRQAERVFAKLVAQYGYRKAIVRYNGSGPRAEAYAQWVLKQVRRIG